MDNIIEKQINEIIEFNNKLIESKKELLTTLGNKLEKGRIIFGSNLIADKFDLDYEDGRLVVKILVHPNFRLGGLGDYGPCPVPSVVYGCCLDMIKFPIEYLSKVDIQTIEEFYEKHKEEIIEKYVQKFHCYNDKAINLEERIKDLEKEISNKKEQLSELKNLLNQRNVLIDNLTNNYEDKVKETIKSTPLHFASENQLENAWEHYKNNSEDIRSYGF